MAIQRIHIVGISPRSGTTLLAESMAQCFDIDAVEPHEAKLRSRRPGSRIYLTKMPDDIKIVGPRLKLDPRLSVICLMRDPRDIIVSRHAKDSTRYWAPLSTFKANYRHVRKLLGHPRFLMVRYEDLVARPDEVQQQIARRLPFLRQLHAFSRYSEVAAPSDASLKALGSVRPISTSSVGAWRDHLPRVAGQIERHGGISSELIELGYETDDAWLQELLPVTPDLGGSHREEYAQGRLGEFLRLQLGRAYPEALRALAEWWFNPNSG